MTLPKTEGGDPEYSQPTAHYGRSAESPTPGQQRKPNMHMSRIIGVSRLGTYTPQYEIRHANPGGATRIEYR